jgi:hypothetical protein
MSERDRCRLALGLSAPDPDVAEVLLTDWTIRETAEGGRHFVGLNPQKKNARISSAIVEFDSVMMTGKTRSGRVYTLLGEPDPGRMNDLAWAAWCTGNGIDPRTTSVAHVAGTASPAYPQ